ncbi:uncharacterized protein LOC121378725 [Gigantopelta aegis]|uniref:uncharacterized protein LOC121378725 n=1 Tax=Gigantopelta aegis TaxID=1735272 RepID=UPI001B88DB22|nr:uncharacterized protein LOC121378725 [Gigantopelta aegis]
MKETVQGENSGIKWTSTEILEDLDFADDIALLSHRYRDIQREAESWKVTKGICQMLEVFQNKCFRGILRIYWPNKITNKELQERTGMQPISLEVKRRRWKWIGHVCRMPLTSIPTVAMRWTSGGKRMRGRPNETWKRSVEREMKALAWSWGQVTKLATDRKHWRTLVLALCVTAHEDD